jgi:predicted alpha/beta superfamily hydrolase
MRLRYLAGSRISVVAAVIVATMGCGSSPAATGPAAPAPALAAPSRAPGNAPHASFTLTSQGLGELRRLHLYTPPGYVEAPTARFPVLYLLDGGDTEDFPHPHILATIDAAIRARQMQPIVVVGIENTERRRDTTGPTTVDADKTIAPRVGGSARFRAFIRDELMPEIARRVRTSGTTAIMGESLAGLFVVETFFVEPTLFDSYIAISPRVSWNASVLVRGAEDWLASHPTLVRTLYLAGAGDDDIDDQRAKLGQILATRAPAGLTWFYEPRPDLRHANIYETVAPSVLRRLFPPSSPPAPR